MENKLTKARLYEMVVREPFKLSELFYCVTYYEEYVQLQGNFGTKVHFSQEILECLRFSTDSGYVEGNVIIKLDKDKQRRLHITLTE